MPHRDSKLVQCPVCLGWLRVRDEEAFETHKTRCRWRKQQWMLSVVAILLSISALAISLLK